MLYSELLLSRSASISLVDAQGNGPLHHACIEKLDDIACLLIKESANQSTKPLLVDLQNKRGQTYDFIIANDTTICRPLHLATPAGLYGAVSEILLISQASLLMLDENERVPLISGMK